MVSFTLLVISLGNSLACGMDNDVSILEIDLSQKDTQRRLTRKAHAGDSQAEKRDSRFMKFRKRLGAL